MYHKFDDINNQEILSFCKFKQLLSCCHFYNTQQRASKPIKSWVLKEKMG